MKFHTMHVGVEKGFHELHNSGNTLKFNTGLEIKLTFSTSLGSKPAAHNDITLKAFRNEREREMFYLTTHSTHFIYVYMVKDHSDSEKGNPLPPHRLLFSINSKGSFICTIPQTGYHIPRPLLHQSWCTGWNEK